MPETGSLTLAEGDEVVERVKHIGYQFCRRATRFADEEGIDCLHFILNDKKELVHGNQLSKIAELSRDHGVQVVISMLRDKLPRSMDCSEYIILSLSQDDKLFRIERH